ncbi:MAG: glycosyltransferase [Marinovum sp.]|nr:glycosyltransferase [Marinovum sp.]
MLKEPRPGRVKTRLGRDIGMTTAAWWFRHQTAKLLRRLEYPRWTLWVAVSPDHAGHQSRIWPAHLPRLGQGTGNLGDRMARLFRSLPPGPMCIIGGDIPEIEPHHIADAFGMLGSRDAVFGPAPDGGYWLVGLKRSRAVPTTLFNDVRWSTRHALADSEASLGTLRIGHVATLRDVDTVADLKP